MSTAFATKGKKHSIMKAPKIGNCKKNLFIIYENAIGTKPMTFVPSL